MVPREEDGGSNKKRVKYRNRKSVSLSPNSTRRAVLLTRYGTRSKLSPCTADAHTHTRTHTHTHTHTHTLQTHMHTQTHRRPIVNPHHKEGPARFFFPLLSHLQVHGIEIRHTFGFVVKASRSVSRGQDVYRFLACSGQIFQFFIDKFFPAHQKQKHTNSDETVIPN